MCKKFFINKNTHIKKNKKIINFAKKNAEKRLLHCRRFFKHFIFIHCLFFCGFFDKKNWFF